MGSLVIFCCFALYCWFWHGIWPNPFRAWGHNIMNGYKEVICTFATTCKNKIKNWKVLSVERHSPCCHQWWIIKSKVQKLICKVGGLLLYRNFLKFQELFVVLSHKITILNGNWFSIHTKKILGNFFNQNSENSADFRMLIYFLMGGKYCSLIFLDKFLV